MGRVFPWRQYDIDSLDNRDDRAFDFFHRHFHGLLHRYFRATVRGVERIPAGPALYVGNHNSILLSTDTFVLFSEIYRQRGMTDMPFGLGHEMAIRVPIAHQIVVPLGAVRASHENAHRIFARGHKVLVYPGGDVDAMRPYRHRNRVVFGGRTGFIRLAVREGVPVVPLVSAGSHGTAIVLDDMRWLAKLVKLARWPVRSNVWPLTLSLPWGLTLGPPMFYVPLPVRMIIEVLPAITFPRTGEEAANDESYVKYQAERVRCTMELALQRLALERGDKV